MPIAAISTPPGPAARRRSRAASRRPSRAPPAASPPRRSAPVSTAMISAARRRVVAVPHELGAWCRSRRAGSAAAGSIRRLLLQMPTEPMSCHALTASLGGRWRPRRPCRPSARWRCWRRRSRCRSAATSGCGPPGRSPSCRSRGSPPAALPQRQPDDQDEEPPKAARSANVKCMGTAERARPGARWPAAIQCSTRPAEGPGGRPPRPRRPRSVGPCVALSSGPAGKWLARNPCSGPSWSAKRTAPHVARRPSRS